MPCQRDRRRMFAETFLTIWMRAGRAGKTYQTYLVLERRRKLSSPCSIWILAPVQSLKSEFKTIISH